MLRSYWVNYMWDKDFEFVENDELLKIEHTPDVIKEIHLFNNRSEIIIPDSSNQRNSNRLLSIMQDYGDITINATTTDPILNCLIIPSDKLTLRSKVAQLLGKYAEALMVMNCRETPSFNRHFARLASSNQRRNNNYLDNFIAIATGSPETERKYNHHYQPNERQRDIVWVDERDVMSLLTPTVKKVGQIAGLQIKVSYDWRYPQKQITKYKCPVLYFSMSDDWNKLNDFINIKKQADSDYQDVNLLPMDEYSHQILDSLFWFEKELIDLIEGRTSIRKLVECAKYKNQTAVGHAITRDINSNTTILIPADVIREADRERRERHKKETTERLNRIIRELGRKMLNDSNN